METFTAVTNPEFIIRINGYIKECERKPMQFRNEKHRSVFENAIFIPSPLAEKLMEEAEQRGVTVEELLTTAIKNYINKENDDE